jgi:hypothetical protein
MAASSDFIFDGDFTIDFWCNLITNSSYHHFFTLTNQSTFSFKLADSSGLIYLYTGGTDISYTSGTELFGSWNHVALVRSGTGTNNLKLYINGAQVAQASANDTWGDGSETAYIGWGWGTEYTKGYIDEFRISKGIARWTSNFTPPTRPYGDALTVDGPKGNLYTVTDSMETHGSGSVFSVNTTGGLPALNVLDNGCVTKPYQPAFSVGMSAYQNNIAVGSSYIPIQFDTDSGGGNFNQGGHYNTSNYTFTAPVTGKYQFNAVVQIFNLDIDADYYEMLLETSNKVYDAVMIDPNAFDQDVPYWYFNMSILTAMDVGDTCILNIRQLGNSSTAQADITTNSVYSGYLVC